MTRETEHFLSSDFADDEKPAKTPNSSSSSSNNQTQNSPNCDQISSRLASMSIPKSKSPKTSKPNTNYINVAPLPIFHGDKNECPVRHLSRFAKVCRANNASSVKSMMKIFPVTLEGEAALWYDLNIEPGRSLTWEEIKASFLDAYRSVELADGLRSEIMVLDQGDQEPVRSYFLRMQWVLDRWPEHGLPEELLMGVFVDGLREEIRNWIVPQKPNSLNKAVRLAIGFERVRTVRRRRKCGFCGAETHEETGCEARERMRELWLKGRSKEEKQLVTFPSCSSPKIGENGSGGFSGGGAGEGEEGVVVGWKKKRQCQCWKHECGKRRLERNYSFVSRDSNLGL